MTWVTLYTIGKEILLVPALPAASIGGTYSQVLSVIGAIEPITIDVVSTDLPSYNESPAEWTITDNGDGTVTVASDEVETAGSFTINFIVSDADRQPILITKTLNVVALALQLTGTLDAPVLGIPYSDSLTREGGIAPFTFSISSGALPAGLSINSSTGVVSGTPSVSGAYAFTIKVEDDVGSEAFSPQSGTVTVDDTLIRRSLRSKTAMAYNLNGSLVDSGRTGLSLTGTASYVTGPDGVSQALSAGSSSVTFTQNNLRGLNCFDARQKFAISFFVRHTSSRPNGSTSFMLSMAQSGVNRISITQGAAGTSTDPLPVSFFVGGQTVTSSSNMPYNAWTCVQINVDGSNITIDFDRTQVASAALTATVIAAFTQWAIGQSGGSAPASLGYDFANFVYLHDSATSDEFDYLYNSGDGRLASDWMTVAYGTTPDAFAASILVAGDGYWRMSETSGTSAADSVSGGIGALTGTNGAAMVTTIDPPAGFSTADGVGDVDGVDDYFAVPGVNFTSGSTQYTMATWVYFDAVSTSDVMFHFGSNAGNYNDARSLNLGFPDGSVVQTFAADGSGSAAGNAVNSPTGTATSGAWLFFAGINQTAGLNQVLMHNGVVIGVIAGAFAPTSANLTACSIGGRGGTLGMDGKLSRALFAKGHTLTIPQISQLYDLGVSTANQ